MAGSNGQKAYDKSWNLLGVENTLNRPEAFTVLASIGLRGYSVGEFCTAIGAKMSE